MRALVILLYVLALSCAVYAESLQENSKSVLWDWCEQPRLPKLIDTSARRNQAVHIASTFLFPLDPNKAASNNVTRQQHITHLTVKEDSVLRVAVEPTQHFDLGLFLYHEQELLVQKIYEGKHITLSRNTQDEEMLTAKLVASEKYVLVFYSTGFLDWAGLKNLLLAQQNENNGDFWCPTVRVELAVLPVTQVQKRVNTINAKCPANPQFPDLKLQDLHNNNDLRVFGFDGSSNTYFAPYVKNQEHIKVEKVYEFVAPTVAQLWLIDIQVYYDFVTNGAFGMFLTKTFNQLQEITDINYVAKCIASQTCTPGVRRHVNSLILSDVIEPGFNYSILLYNDYTKHVDFAPNCVPFTINVTLLPLTKSFDNLTDMMTCDMAERLPRSLNNAGFLNEASSQTLHFSRKLFANRKHLDDYTKFTLMEDSLIRVYVQQHHRVNTEIVISKEKRGNVVATHKTNGKESLLVELGTGDYFLEFKYSAVTNKGLPMPEECVAISCEIAIEPITTVKGDNATVENCDEAKIPMVIAKDAHFYKSSPMRSVSQPLIRNISFVAEKESILSIRVTDDFLTGGITFELSGEVNLLLGNSKALKQTTTKRRYTPQIYDGTVYLNRLVPRGKYTLTFMDATKYPSWLRCSRFFELEVTLIPKDYLHLINDTQTSTNTVPTPTVNCPVLRNLPDALFSKESIEFGGPQKANGEILFRAKHVKLSLNSQFRALFLHIPEASVIRAFLISNSDIPMQLALAKPGRDTPLDVMPGKKFKNYVTFADNMLVPNTQMPYELIIAHKGTMTKTTLCPPDYSLQVQVVTLKNFRRAFECSNSSTSVQLPAAVKVSDTEFHLVNDRFFINGKEAKKNLNSAHRMTIEILREGTYFMSAVIQYNFLAADLSLQLSSNNVLQETGTPKIDLNRGSQFRYNFKNVLEMRNLTKGTYNLDLVDANQDVVHKLREKDCLHFYFNLNIQQAGSDTRSEYYKPRVLSVDPYEQHIVKANSLLVLNIEFSEDVAFPATDKTDLQEELEKQKVVYLKDISQVTGLETRSDVHPIVVQFKTNKRNILQVLFVVHEASLHNNGAARFELALNSTFFKTTKKESFELPSFILQSPPTYVVQVEKKKKQEKEQEIDEREKEELKEEQEEREKRKYDNHEIEKELEQQQQQQQKQQQQQQQQPVKLPPQTEKPTQPPRSNTIDDATRTQEAQPKKEISCAINCGIHGTCNSKTGKCLCVKGFTGENCSEPVMSDWDIILFAIRMALILFGLFLLIGAVILAIIRIRFTATKMAPHGSVTNETQQNIDGEENVFIFENEPNTLDVIIEEEDEDQSVTPVITMNPNLEKIEREEVRMDQSIGNDKL